MTALAFTAEEWAAKMAAAMTDQSYRSISEMGRLAARYVDQLRFEDYSPESIDNREPVLRYLAIDFIGRDPATITTEDLRAFLARHWADAQASTRSNRVSLVRAFFRWAFENDHIPVDVSARIKAPSKKQSERQAHGLEEMQKIVAGQPYRRDRIAIQLLYTCGLRKSELRAVQFKHFDFSNRLLVVFGKGGTVLDQSVPVPLRDEIERFKLDQQFHGDHFLMHPTRVGRAGMAAVELWRDPSQAMTPSGVHRWWHRCLERAGVPPFPMHEVRHTAGTHFYLASRDLVATQHFMRHKDIGVTANTYLHTDRIRTVSDHQDKMPDPFEASR